MTDPPCTESEGFSSAPLDASRGQRGLTAHWPADPAKWSGTLTFYPKEDLAELYWYRWNAELDIRDIKQTLGLDHTRCKSPGMVQCELWVTFAGVQSDLEGHRHCRRPAR